MLALHHAGQRGVTALEMGGWALRLAAYAHYLGKKGLVINTIRENHPGGWHGRHILASPIQIISVEGGDFAQARAA